MSNKIYIDKKTYNNVVPLSAIKHITSFREQRTINNDRIKLIQKIFETKLKKNKFTSFNFSTPLIFIKTSDNILLNKNNIRTNVCIVDGQHRLNALIKLQQKYKKIDRLNIPILVHNVNSIDEADKIQYELFEQKPFSDADKIKQGDYNINFVINQCIDHLRHDYNKNIITNQNEKKYRRTHFNKELFEKSITNSPNINKWIEFKINNKELFRVLHEIMNVLENEFNSLQTTQSKLNYLQCKSNKKFKKLNKFTIMTTKYFKKYDNLVKSIELELCIINDSESDSDSDSDD